MSEVDYGTRIIEEAVLTVTLSPQEAGLLALVLDVVDDSPIIDELCHKLHRNGADTREAAANHDITGAITVRSTLEG